MAGRAKWDAWAGMEGKYGKEQAEAEKRYVEVAKEFGWDEAVAAPQPSASSSRAAQSEEEEINFDSDEEDWRKRPQRPKGDGSGGGPKTANDASIHGLTVSGDVARLKSLFELNSNLDINEKDQYGYTPLHLACDRGHLDVVKLLLEKGADRSIQDPDEFTPLELAEVAGRTDIVELLSS
ncbi:ankyrin [Coprinellus micaceus]|uniref:Ankyrin n=1 Tax=Coprinellus micaceus TaxID=71717 RepID=A0A4Y7TLS4_COPMI|nr:ankyrin [Coprinellus micaceus]